MLVRLETYKEDYFEEKFGEDALKKAKSGLWRYARYDAENQWVITYKEV